MIVSFFTCLKLCALTCVRAGVRLTSPPSACELNSSVRGPPFKSEWGGGGWIIFEIIIFRLNFREINNYLKYIL